MSGGPIDMTPFGNLTTGIGIAYLFLAIAALYVALKRPVTRRGKMYAGMAVIAVFGVLPLSGFWNKLHATTRLDKALALFNKQCTRAGEKIYRTAENVEGVAWMRWRDEDLNFSDQFRLNDPYGQDCTGEACILSLLRASRGIILNPEGAKRKSIGYIYVETTSPDNGQHFRYFGAMKLAPSWTPEGITKLKKETGRDPPDYSHILSAEREPIKNITTRYGVTWDDISTKEDREYWIAGSSLKIIDLRSNEILAQRIGYLIDRGQGNTAGFRAPWTWARSYGPACPPLQERAADFIFKVLKPTKLGE